MRIIFKKWAAWPLAMLLFFVFATQAGAVQYPLRVSLNGNWQRQLLTDYSPAALASTGWSDAKIPAIEYSPAGHFAAYRRVFVNPAKNPGDKVFIHFKGVAYACKIYLNSRLVGEHGPTLEPFDYDITSFLKKKDSDRFSEIPPGSPLQKGGEGKDENELIVMVQDWTSGIEITPSVQLKHRLHFRPGTSFTLF